jgi:DNA-binding MarR family transcriptional regulator
MQQFEFVVGENGLLSEAAAAEQAEWYLSKCPDLEVLDFEAHLMVMRAYSALQTDTPFEHRGGLTRARYNVLRILHGDDQKRKLMTDIVISMSVSPTNITKLVDGLERDGYVCRVPSGEDKRKVWVELTPSGSRVVEETLPDVVHHVSHLWQGLTLEEKRVLVHLLAKLRLDILTRSAGQRVEDVCIKELAKASA